MSLRSIPIANSATTRPSSSTSQKTATSTAPQAERLQKVLSRAGIASRRTAEQMIQLGRVQVNGETITRLGTMVDPQNDRILVDGRLLSSPRAHVYFLLHKPIGVVSTLNDPQGRPTVRDLLPRVRERVYPVGRLDYDSSGLLLLTNDGELTERLLHPRYQVPRIYHAKVKGTPAPETLQALRDGVALDDGTVAKASEVAILRITFKKAWLSVALREGRNREVRRMCEAVGHPVEKLVRVQFGSLSLGNLEPGDYRPLTVSEIAELKQAVGQPRKPRA